MTPSQIDVIGQLKEKILADDAQGRTEWEYKKFHVSEYAGEKAVFLWSITGHRQDEGTLAQVLYRKERFIYVGPRGRILVLNQDDQQLDGPELLSLKVALKEPARRPVRSQGVPAPGHAQQAHEQVRSRPGTA